MSVPKSVKANMVRIIMESIETPPIEDRYAVENTIVLVVLPMAYQIISELIDCNQGDKIPKNLLNRARQLLPLQYKHSFGNKPK